MVRGLHEEVMNEWVFLFLLLVSRDVGGRRICGDDDVVSPNDTVYCPIITEVMWCYHSTTKSKVTSRSGRSEEAQMNVILICVVLEGSDREASVQVPVRSSRSIQQLVPEQPTLRIPGLSALSSPETLWQQRAETGRAGGTAAAKEVGVFNGKTTAHNLLQHHCWLFYKPTTKKNIQRSLKLHSPSELT